MTYTLIGSPQACCAHLRVKYQTAKHPKGGTVGWWACKACGQHFMPVPIAMGDAAIREDVEPSNPGVRTSPANHTLIEEIKTVISVKMHEFFVAGNGGCDVSSWTEDFAQKLCSLQQREIPVISDKDLRKHVMAAIRSYGYDTQSKATLESRTDGVMIVLAEYVLPFLQREPKREAQPAGEISGKMLVSEEHVTSQWIAPTLPTIERFKKYEVISRRDWVSVLSMLESFLKREICWVHDGTVRGMTYFGDTQLSDPLIFKTTITKSSGRPETHLRLGLYDKNCNGFIESGFPEKIYRNEVDCWYQFPMPKGDSIEDETTITDENRHFQYEGPDQECGKD